MLYFLKFKDLTCNFCAFSRFFYFSVSFYPIWMKLLSKFRENVGLQAYYLGLVLNQSWTGLRTAVFSGLSQKNWEVRDCWSAWTGYSPVRFSVPFRSYEPDLEALNIWVWFNGWMWSLFHIRKDGWFFWHAAIYVYHTCLLLHAFDSCSYKVGVFFSLFFIELSF